jgi:hypothetical protein
MYLSTLRTCTQSALPCDCEKYGSYSFETCHATPPCRLIWPLLSYAPWDANHRRPLCCLRANTCLATDGQLLDAALTRVWTLMNHFLHVTSCTNRFVLNSPRSLRACHHFGVRPVELLPRSMAEFEEVSERADCTRTQGCSSNEGARVHTHTHTHTHTRTHARSRRSTMVTNTLQSAASGRALKSHDRVCSPSCVRNATATSQRRRPGAGRWQRSQQPRAAMALEGARDHSRGGSRRDGGMLLSRQSPRRAVSRWKRRLADRRRHLHAMRAS